MPLSKEYADLWNRGRDAWELARERGMVWWINGGVESVERLEAWGKAEMPVDRAAIAPPPIVPDKLNQAQRIDGVTLALAWVNGIEPGEGVNSLDVDGRYRHVEDPDDPSDSPRTIRAWQVQRWVVIRCPGTPVWIPRGSDLRTAIRAADEAIPLGGLVHEELESGAPACNQWDGPRTRAREAVSCPKCLEIGEVST